MARLHTRKRGKHGSKRPIIKDKPSWVQYSKEEVERIIIKLAKEGYKPAMIGLILRDRYGIPLVKPIIGKKLEEFLKEKGLIELPSDLWYLLKKAVNLIDHLQEHKMDIHNKRNLNRIESKIKRLVKYYKRVGKLPKDWVYSRENAKLIVRKV